MSTLPSCPQCNSEYAYEDGLQYICPECGHEWSINDESNDSKPTHIDAVGHALKDGDTITVAKDLKIKGTNSVIKVGTKVKNIRLVEADSDGGHNIDCKVPGFGPMKLTSQFLKKKT